ncbi:putative LPS assembly protein LptD [Fulvivirga lutea]|uniref:LPS-assembly protein LptD n=1 Tax=Fulvivirga lutea TaxID=2810512 RepID=A0A974WKC1_9BACT|nr:putative LPS assembly protein LptD [Fulvivirga lutea]QSE97745.1 LPS-assembly protein LptD [Fulvivirga lutea]
MKFCLLFLFCTIFTIPGLSQNPENELNIQTGDLNEIPVKNDSLLSNDSTVVALDSLSNQNPADSASKPPPKGDIETTIKYSAKDSINFSVDSKIVQLYGDAKIKYGSIELEAENITIDYNNNTLSAKGKVDSTGTKIGFPIFKNGSEVYETKDITYNFKTGRARISEVVTQQGEGYLHGETVYKNAQNELFSIDNSYTTCNLAHPHYRIRAKRTKAIPDDKIVSGPANLEINDVPTPLWLPFGMFPAKNEASSGVIIPSYGEESRRGFFIRGGGYFFDVSDYFKATLTGDLYSKGGHGINFNSVYKKRYAFNGNLNFAYTKIRLSDQIEDESNQNDFRLTWSHNPESKGNSRFNASVNAATSTYNQNNFIGINGDANSNRFDNVTRQLSSNVAYSKTFGNSPFTLGISARHNQDIRTREVDLQLPSLTLNMGNVYPLASETGTGPGWMEKLNLRYTMAGTNQITNNVGRIGADEAQDSIAPFDFDNLGTFFKNAKNGVRHTIPLSTSFKMLKHFTASPSLNYEETWYFESLIWDLDTANQSRAVVVDTLSGFNRISTYSVGTSFNTRLYGTYFFKKGKVEAIRHVMNPNISFNYAPDFSDDRYGYFQRLENENGDELLQSRYQGFVYGSPRTGENASIGLSLNNTLEMKVKAKSDTAEVKSKKVPLLNNFGFSTSYNLVAEEFQLSNFSIRANTSILDNKFNINFNGTIDPYVYILDSINFDTRGRKNVFQRRIDRYAWNNGDGLGQLSQATIAISTNLNPKARNKDNTTNNAIQNSDLNQDDKDFLLANPDSYVDFNIPWSLRLNYSLNFSQRGFEDSNTTQSLRFSGDFSLTEKWKITFNSGYDFENKDFTTTRLGITRDLHCWQMDFNWTPFGRFQSYSFSIHVKSSLLQDLKIDRNRSFFDR